jgi:hypothetical protein
MPPSGKVVVFFQHRSASGKVCVDNARLAYTLAANAQRSPLP